MSSTLQTITAVVFIFATLFFGWFLIFGTPSEADLAGADPRQQASYQSREFRTILSELNSINLQSELTTDPSFLQMQDETRDIEDRGVGRVNPFGAI